MARKRDDKTDLVRVRKAGEREQRPTWRDGEAGSAPIASHNRRSFPKQPKREDDAADWVGLDGARPRTSVLSVVVCIRCRFEGFVPFAVRSGEEHLCPDCYAEVTRPRDAAKPTRTHYSAEPRGIVCALCGGVEAVHFSPVPEGILCSACYRHKIRNRKGARGKT
ncbi:MAG: hypothetical protein KC609_23085 [Myxococcales bacterium]|nr:hypothetical protein [Myxococcales bacterium]